MTTTRRKFMHQVGVTLAALVASGCERPAGLTLPPSPEAFTPPPYSCYQPPAAPPLPTTAISHDDKRWQTLRDCWLNLRDPKLQAQKETGFAESLRRQHAETLTTLTTNGQMDDDVAEAIGVAFREAIIHVQRQAAACCYEPLPVEFGPRQNLLAQVNALTEMARRSQIDTATVERARTALERDVAWLGIFQTWRANTGNIESISVGESEVEAARVLVELLLR